MVRYCGRACWLQDIGNRTLQERLRAFSGKCAVQGTDNDTLEIEIWQSWLQPSNKAEFEHQQANRCPALPCLVLHCSLEISCSGMPLSQLVR